MNTMQVERLCNIVCELEKDFRRGKISNRLLTKLKTLQKGAMKIYKYLYMRYVIKGIRNSQIIIKFEFSIFRYIIIVKA